MKVAQANAEMETEQDFISDLYACVASKVSGMKNGTHTHTHMYGHTYHLHSSVVLSNDAG